MLPVVVTRSQPTATTPIMEIKNENVTTVTLELDTDGNEIMHSKTTSEAPVAPAPNSEKQGVAAPPNPPSGRSESSLLMSKLDAQYEHFRSYLNTKYGVVKSNYKHSINAYGDNDHNHHHNQKRHVNGEKQGPVPPPRPDRIPIPSDSPDGPDTPPPMPLELYVSLAGMEWCNFNAYIYIYIYIYTGRWCLWTLQCVYMSTCIYRYLSLITICTVTIYMCLSYKLSNYLSIY